MVNNCRCYIKQEIGRAINPYDAESPLTVEEALDEYGLWMECLGFENAEKLVYHPSTSSDEDQARFELLETAASDFYSRGNTPEIYVPKSDQEKVLDSKILHEEAINYNEPETTEDDISQSLDSDSDRSIHITSDYHAEGLYGLRHTFDDTDFILLSAETSKIDPDPNEYTDILGFVGPVAARIFGWKTLAEGKEVGRELLEKTRGPRF